MWTREFIEYFYLYSIDGTGFYYFDMRVVLRNTLYEMYIDTHNIVLKLFLFKIDMNFIYLYQYYFLYIVIGKKLILLL